MAHDSLNWCIVIWYLIPVCLGFNIDVRFPVIKEGKTKGSFFGFSVAQHYQTEQTRRYLLLAGAPKEKARALRNVNETGAIYSCPISTDPTDCSRMDIISSTDASEMVEGMWLGVTVASQRDQPAGRVLACGHRYMKVVRGGTEEQRRMVGKCFVRGNDLTFDPSDEWQAHSYEVCNPNFDMELEGMCSMGISGGMTETDVYIGSVGSYLWQGNVHVTWRDPTPGNSWDSNVKDFGQLNRRYSYMGYTVLKEKRLLSREEYTVVTGSPRDGSRGSVTLADKQDSNLVDAFTIPGKQVGSYFGSSIAVTDLNNDGWNDLIVGAPFYFDRYREEGGAVHVYMNENGSFQKTASVVLKGHRGSGFGFAVAAIGDVNQDGFQDFAVGAPFHDSGRLFIWTGSKEGITATPSQKIKGKEVGTGGFQTFGYSINGGIDMDDNLYPDILVGSLDDRIALLRARPVVHLAKNFTIEPKIVDPNHCGVPCVAVKVCFSFTLSNGNKDFKKNITVNYTIVADRHRRAARVRFMNDQASYNALLSFSVPTCQVLKLKVAEPLRDKLERVAFSLNVSLQEQRTKVRRSLQNLDAFPVLSGSPSLTEYAEIHFQKECGSDNQCSSNLQFTAEYRTEQLDPFPVQDGSQVMSYNSKMKKLILQVEVTNQDKGLLQAEDAHQAMLSISIPSPLRYSGVRTTPPNIECSTEETILCDLGNPFKSNDQSVSLRLIFEIFDITLDTNKIDTQLQLSTVSEQHDLDPVNVSIKVENTILTSLSMEKSEVSTFFSGTVMGESAMNTTSDVGSLVEFVFRVYAERSLQEEMGTLAVEFEWPFEVTNGKWLLYLTEIVTKGTSETHCSPPGDVVNLLNLTLSDRTSRRSRREVDGFLPKTEASVTLLGPRKEIYLLDCAEQTARCVTFTCPLRNMSRDAQIIVRSRVWNSTMLEDYINALRVKVQGQATLKLVTDNPTIKINSQMAEFSVVIDPLLWEDTPYEIPLWIIIVAAVAGVLLLGFISLVLWKCGFFKREVYYKIMPKYHGVKIKKEERYQLKMGFQPEELNKKLWVTSWTEMQHYY